MRIGGATQLALHDVHALTIQAAGGWRTIGCFLRYWQHASVLIQADQLGANPSELPEMQPVDAELLAEFVRGFRLAREGTQRSRLKPTEF